MFVVEAVLTSRSLNSQPAALPLGECGRTTRLTPLAVKSKEHRANLNTKVTIPPSEFYERVSLVLAGGFGGARVDGRSRRSGVKVGVKTDDIWLESGGSRIPGVGQEAARDQLMWQQNCPRCNRFLRKAPRAD